jgi:hypothetical protein
MFVFINEYKGKTKAFAIIPYKVGDAFENSWGKNKQSNQWLQLLEFIEKYQPNKIGMNHKLMLMALS